VTSTDTLPAEVDTIVVGGGTAGCVIAGRLAELKSESILLLEAGPDYGPADSGRWPEDLMDATSLAMWSHDWGYTGEYAGQPVHFNRARVMGGCSSHNAGAVVYGSRLDYDAWAAAGNPGWSTHELLPLFDLAWKQLRVRVVGLDELTPFQSACMDAMVANGIPAVDDFNDLDENLGVAPFPVNLNGGLRINSAFAYVDPVRDRGNIQVLGDVLIDRLLIRGGRVEGVVVQQNGSEHTVRAARVVLSAGAYGTPAIMLRSGIGPADELADVGVISEHDLPGVGRNLHDQPSLEIDYAGSDELIDEMERHREGGWRPDEQVIGKLPSSLCAEGGFDLHIYPIGGRQWRDKSRWRWTIGAALLKPRSRGSIRLSGAGAEEKPIIDHRYLSDPGGSDLSRLAECVERARQVAAVPELRRLIGDEIKPGPGVADLASVKAFLQRSAIHYYHPCGSCKMGPASDATAVVDSEGHVHGIDGLYVADASIMPDVMSGNTNMPVTVIGERIARGLVLSSRAAPGERAAVN
jgi:choline dehydrogenase